MKKSDFRFHMNIMKLFPANAKLVNNPMDHRKVLYVCTKCNKEIGNYQTRFCPHCGRRVKYE